VKTRCTVKACLASLLFGVLAAGLSAPASAADPAAKKIKVLVYGGGSVHDFKAINQVVMETLGACPQLELTSITDTVIPAPPAEPGQPPARPQIKSALDAMLAQLPQCDVLFFHHTGGKLTPAQEDALCGAIASGKGFVGIHSAADSFKQNAKYMDMIGGSFRTHPAYQPIPTTVLDSAHPIVKGIPAEFSVTDEQYFLKYDPAKVHVLCDAPYKLMEYKMVDKEKGGKTVKTRVATGKILEQGRMPNVWTKPCDKGRVVYISFCHDAKAARQPIVKQLLLQSVLWAGGAP
jgi:type 1 glutamine amidotransferase